jgi:tetratricopeptide (TPR) repeat protein
MDSNLIKSGRPNKGGNRRARLAAAHSPAAKNTPDGKDDWMLGAAVTVILLVLAVFGQTRNFGFLNFDDNQYIQEIPAVCAGLKWESIKWAWLHSHVGQWHPLTTMSFMFDAEMGALKTGGGFHLQNVFHQALASVLLLFALRSLTGSFWRSAIAAAIFAVHPLRAESVAWITERKDVLSGVFLMATLWAYSHYVKQPKSWGRYLLVCVLFALGLLSKPMLVSLPFVFLLLDVWPLNRLSWDKVPSSGQEWLTFLNQLRPLVLEKAPIFVMAFASAVGAIYAVGEPFRPIPILDLIPRLKYIPISYATYLWQFIFPFNLAAHYPFVATGPATAKVVAAVLLLLGLSVLAWNRRKQHPYFLVGWLWFLGTMLPVIGLVPGGIQIMCDRYTYLTQIGLAVALVWAVANWVQRGLLPLSKISLGVLTGALIVGLAAVARNQANQWKDDKTLWTHALAVTTDNDYANEKLATTLQSQGERQESERLYREALRLNTRLVGSLNNLSILLRARGEFTEATKFQQMAVNEHPKWGLMRRNLGSALIQEKRPTEAIEAFREAVRLDPNDLEAKFNMGLVYSEYLGGKDNLEEAARHFQELIQKQPGFVEAHFSLGNAYYRLGKMDEAAQAYNRTLQLAPNHAKAANNLASIFSSRKQIPEAIALYKRAMVADPTYIESGRNLAEALTASGSYAEAAQVWRELITRKGDDLQSIFRLSWLLATCPDATVRRAFEARDLALKGIALSGSKEGALFDSLAAAQAHLGNFKEAEQAARQAVELSQANPASQALILKRLELYSDGKSYVESRTQTPQ